MNQPPISMAFSFVPLVIASTGVPGAVFAALFFFAVLIVFSLKDVQFTDNHFVIAVEKIPWSNIDHISLKENELGNKYLKVYFRDDTLPNGYDIGFIHEKKSFAEALEKQAAEKGFTFDVQEGITIEDEKIGTFEMVEKEKTWSKPEPVTPPEISLSPRQKSFAKIFLAVAFFVGAYIVFGAAEAVSLVIILIVHEGGHWAALKWYGLKVQDLFFIPFVGGGIIPKGGLPSPEVEAKVALAGPAAAVLLNVGVGLIWVISPGLFSGSVYSSLIAFLRALVLWNIGINLINCAPVLPLDGGRIFRAALLRGRKSIIPVSLVTVGIGIALVIFFESIILLVFVLFGLSSLIHSYKQLEEKETVPPSWGASLGILGAWIVIVFLLFLSGVFIVW